MKRNMLRTLGIGLLAGALALLPSGAFAVPDAPAELDADPAEVLDGLGEDSSAEDLEAEGYIVGGADIAIANVPWQVALVHSARADNYNGQFCGGSVIARQWILTAAHCVVSSSGKKTRPSEARVLAGVDTLSATSKAGRRTISKIVAHPQYRPATKVNDIALIKLAKPLKYSSKIRPIALPSMKASVGAAALISGWGNTYAKNAQGVSSNPHAAPNEWPQRLQYTYVWVEDEAVCRSDLPGKHDSRSMLCAKAPANYYRDTCQGDSGGPLATRSNGRWYLSGVTSWGIGCASTTAGEYANVSNYRSWISKSMIEPARSPKFSKVKKGRNAATVNITNYSKQFKYTVKKVSGTGKVVKGKARGSKLPIKVTKIKPGKWVKVKITTKRDGYKTSTKTIKIRR